MKVSLFLFFVGLASLSYAKPKPVPDLFGGLVGGITDSATKIGSGLTGKISEVGDSISRSATQFRSDIRNRVSQSGLPQVGHFGGGLINKQTTTPKSINTTTASTVEIDDDPLAHINCEESPDVPSCRGLIKPLPRKCPPGEIIVKGSCIKEVDIY